MNIREKLAGKELYVFIFLSLLMFIPMLNSSLDGYDQARYFFNAQALMEGKGYVWLWHPFQLGDGYILPGYSSFIAVLMLFSKSVLFIKATQFLFHAGSAAMIYSLVDKRARMFALLFILNPMVIFYSALIAPESLMILLFLGAIYAYEKKQNTLLAGVLAGMCVFVKLESGLLFLSLFAHMLWVNRKIEQNALKLVAGFGGVMLFSIPYIGLILRTQAGYGARVSMTTLAYYFEIPLVMLGLFASILALIFGYKYKKLEQRHLPYLMVSISYLILMVIYPSKDLRYLIMPGIVLLPVFGSIYLGLNLDKGKIGKIALMLLVATMAIAGMYGMVGYSNRMFGQWAEYDAAAERLSEYEHGVILARRAEDAYLYSGMPAITYPYSDDRAVLAESIRTYGAKYIIKDQFEWTKTAETYYYWLKDGERAGGYCFTELFRVDRTVVFEIEEC